MASSTTSTRPTRAVWTACGACISGSTAPPRAATRWGSGGATTTGTAMTEVLIAPVVPHDVETCAEGGNAAPGTTRWLGLAAAPTFAIMALWNGLFSGQPDMLCMAMQGSS